MNSQNNMSFFLVIIFSTQSFVSSGLEITHLNAVTMPQGKLVKYYGYPYENHTIITEDGFFLTLGRIPYRQSTECPKRKAVVLALHGILSNGDAYIYLGRNHSLGLVLHDNCYDVWLMNNRGTRYTNRHANFTTRSRHYWNSTLDDIANDVGITMQYILAATHETSLHAMGFSMGTSLLMVLLSKYPELQEEVKSLQLLAPIAFTDTVDATAKWIPANLLYDICKAAADLLLVPMQGDHYLMQAVTSELCLEPDSLGCKALSGIFSATNETYRDPIAAKQQLLWSRYFPDRMSLKLLLHLIQSHMSGKFSMFDYGSDNMNIYGSETPLDYPLNKLQVPTYLYHSSGDSFSRPDANVKLEKLLGNVKRRYHIENLNFHHTDFTSSFASSSHDFRASILDAMDNHN